MKYTRMLRCGGLVLLLTLMSLTACSRTPAAREEQPFLTQIECTYLTDEGSLALLGELMEEAGIEPRRQEVLFDHAARMAPLLEELPGGFHPAALEELPPYDPYALQDAWVTRYPEFTGYNCRITAFGLLEPFLDIDPAGETRGDALMLDMLALEEDPSVLPAPESRDRFRVLFSLIPTVKSTETGDHVQVVQEDWASRGIDFSAMGTASLITVFFHDAWGETVQELMIGHAGVLFDRGGEELYFLEKIAFQEPYQLTRFENRTQLNDYLMWKYDFYVEGQETARPFILENDRLLEGYRPNAALTGGKN